MDYEKKYKEALEWAKQIKDGKIGVVIDDLVEKFPELKESEDERIRKAIKLLIEMKGNDSIGLEPVYGASYKEMIAWIENIYTEDDINRAYKCADEVQYRKGYEAAKKELEKQGEKKTDDKVEPKFKVGDWVVNKETGTIHQIQRVIEMVTNNIYGYDLTDGGYISTSNFNKYRLWTIQDARNGDMLHTSSTASNETFIFKGLTKEGYIECYCSYDSEDKYCEGKYHFIGKPTFMMHPATKEQRDFLFQKMKEAGYEWDDEKKKLEDIKEQNPTEDNCKISDWDMKGDTIEYNNGYECGKQRVLKYPEDYGLCKKPAWSEEDELNLNQEIYVCHQHGYSGVEIWLKSFKERMKGE